MRCDQQWSLKIICTQITMCSNDPIWYTWLDNILIRHGGYFHVHLSQLSSKAGCALVMTSFPHLQCFMYIVRSCWNAYCILYSVGVFVISHDSILCSEEFKITPEHTTPESCCLITSLCAVYTSCYFSLLFIPSLDFVNVQIFFFRQTKLYTCHEAIQHILMPDICTPQYHSSVYEWILSSC